MEDAVCLNKNGYNDDQERSLLAIAVRFQRANPKTLGTEGPYRSYIYNLS